MRRDTSNMYDPAGLNRRDVRRRFDRAAAGFDDADFVHRTTRDGLLERLAPLRVDARTVLDLGAATGGATEQLRRRFPGARIVSLDLSHEMLRQARRKRRWFSRTAFVQADAEQLPFPDQCFDVVFANLLLPWLTDPAVALAEAARVLQKGGVLAFATLGPDSFRQLVRAWRRIDDRPHVHRFLDMHDVGDALVRAGFADPVLDVDRLTVRYADAARLFDDLTRTGARNALTNRSRGLLGRRRFARLLAELSEPAIDQGIGLDLELVYGHCWGSGPRNEAANYRIDAAEIGRRRKS